MDFADRIFRFVWSLHTDRDGEFRMSQGGHVTLYASCFAAMTLHYLGKLPEVSREFRSSWADYIREWQREDDGYFIGPELVREEIISKEHTWDVVRMHLAVHVLPTLDILGVQPRYPLAFAHPFLKKNYLEIWLEARDWRNAWLEGNNLIFLGQFLVYLRDAEHRPEAQECLDLYFSWLDRNIDPTTGLWGTDSSTSCARAVYGAYHQLLAYFSEDRPVPCPERLVDATLRIQDSGGGFAETGRGGACEDVDAVNILVNLYQRYDYRRPEIRKALRRAYRSVLKRIAPPGGFVYRWGAPFIHMSIPRTSVPQNVPHLFATWFGTHTLALLAEILTDVEPLSRPPWQFNRVLSMGWHRPWDRTRHMLSESDRRAEQEILDIRDSLRRFQLMTTRKIGAMLRYVKFTLFELARKLLAPLKRKRSSF